MFGASCGREKTSGDDFFCKIYTVCPYNWVTCQQIPSKNVNNLLKTAIFAGRQSHPRNEEQACSKSHMDFSGSDLHTAAQYNSHELFNSSLQNQMGFFSPQSTFRLSFYRRIQVTPANKSNSIRVKFQSVKMKWTQRKPAVETTNDRSFLPRSDQLVSRKGGKYRQMCCDKQCCF